MKPEASSSTGAENELLKCKDTTNNSYKDTLLYSINTHESLFSVTPHKEDDIINGYSTDSRFSVESPFYEGSSQSSSLSSPILKTSVLECKDYHSAIQSDVQNIQRSTIHEALNINPIYNASSRTNDTISKHDYNTTASMSSYTLKNPKKYNNSDAKNYNKNNLSSINHNSTKSEYNTHTRSDNNCNFNTSRDNTTSTPNTPRAMTPTNTTIINTSINNSRNNNSINLHNSIKIAQRGNTQGSHTVLQIPANDANTPIRIRTNEPTPILRLSVNPRTRHVSTRENNLTSSTRDDTVWNCFHISNAARGTTEMRHYETYSEMIETSNDSNLSWGEKRSNNDTWREKWVQQTSPSDDSQNTERVFGQSNGYNTQTRERWVERWESDQEIRSVQKMVQENLEDSEELAQQWTEENRHYQIYGIHTFRRSGIDYRDQNNNREWKAATVRIPDSECHNSNDMKELSMEEIDMIQDLKNVQEAVEMELFEESYGLEQRRHKIYRNADGESIETHRWSTRHKDKDESITIESMQYSNGTGYETTTIHRGKSIIKKTTGRRLRDVASSSSDSIIDKFENYGEYVEIDNTNNEMHTSFHDRWWKHDDDTLNTWGEKERYVAYVNSNTESSYDKIKKSAEKWYDNGNEKVVDEWHSEMLLEESNLQVKSEKRCGRKYGNRYSDGTQWGENWEQEYEKDNKNDDLEDQQPIQLYLIEPNGDIRKESIVLNIPYQELTRTYTDEWWKEPSGNSWGKKRGESHGVLEYCEEWYDNGTERQVDRWKVKQDGTREGEKFGSNTIEQVNWTEKWGGDSSECQWVDKRWDRFAMENQLHSWGECWGKESDGSRSWNETWYTNDHSNWGEHAVVKWVQDEFGNETVHKQGQSWKRERSNERQVTDWWVDRYGTCLSSCEKWAHKEGKNESGDRWMEKWNETPTRKSAEKIGRNNRGDEWVERWIEDFDGLQKVKTWAEKQGSNAQGSRWYETWTEEGEKEKFAMKEGSDGMGNNWTEKWGERFDDNGSGEKWCTMWYNQADGKKGGKSWGDKWGEDGQGGHRWGEEWENDHIHKWNYDTDGRPPGC